MRDRIIPASAGQTTAERLAELERTDHPRECGANHVHGAYGEVDDGSSPRVRGKLPVTANHSGCERIIPASAGQTHQSLCRDAEGTDHPRECGANHLKFLNVPGELGSSPRVRGKHDSAAFYIGGDRIIPASAGQTALQREPVAIVRGSSPRVRGKRAESVGNRVASRIIPASAGQTCAPETVVTARSDHPRECGANVPDLFFYRDQVGSSPRVRGKLRRHGMGR